MTIRDAALAVAGLTLALGTGCTGKTDFDITKTFDPVNSNGNYTLTQHVDMASEAGSAWKHRSKIKSLDLVGLTGVMTRNDSGVATNGHGFITISRGGSTATAASWPSEHMPSGLPGDLLPQTINTNLNPSAVTLIEDAIKSDGLFDVTFSGSTDVPLTFAADVTLHLKLKYKVP